MDVCFGENTLQKENSSYTAIKNNLKVKSINTAGRAMTTLTKGNSQASLQGIAYDDRLYLNHISRKDRNAEMVEMKIWDQDA